MILYTPILLGVLGIILIQYIEKGKVMVLQNKQKVSSQWQYKKIIQKLEDFLETKLLQNIPTGNDAKKIEKKIIYTEIRDYLEKLKEEKNDRYN